MSGSQTGPIKLNVWQPDGTSRTKCLSLTARTIKFSLFNNFPERPEVSSRNIWLEYDIDHDNAYATMNLLTPPDDLGHVTMTLVSYPDIDRDIYCATMTFRILP